MQAPPPLRRKPAERAARAVLPGCAVAWTAAEIAHATGIPWLEITLAGTAAAGLAYGKGARAGAGWLLAGAGWSALAARLGPLAGPGLYYPVTQAWAVLSFCGWRWARSHPAVVAAREKRQASEDWIGKRDRWGLAKTHLLDWEPTRLGEKYLVDVRGSGRRASQIANSDIAERIAENQPSPLPSSRVRVKRHRLAGRVEISIRTEDPWAKPITHPALDPAPEIDLSGPYSITKPAVVGQDPETGAPLSLLLCGPGGGRNVSIVAIMNAGKTVLMACIAERVTAARDAILIRINLSIKGDAERSLWGPACHLTALGPRETGRALKVLRVVAGIVEWRSQQPKTTANWVPSPEDPHVVLNIDEIDALADIPACRLVLKYLSSKGREYGVTIVRAGQRGTAEWTGGSDVRALDGVVCLGAVSRSAEAMHAAGDMGLSLPNMAEYGDGREGVWAIAELAGHELGRTFNLSEPDDIRRIVADRARNQPDLKPELKTFLGDSYENLLRSDVFARWVRDQQAPAPAIAHPRPDIPAGQPEGEWPDGLDPSNPLHALAVAVRDGTVLADDQTAAALGEALDIHQREQTTLAALDQEAEAHMDSLDAEDPLRRRLAEIGKRNDETRRQIAETAAMPMPDLTHDQLIAHAAARWQELGEKTIIPDEAREVLLRLLAAGTTIPEVARTLDVSKWIARTYLERLRGEGLVRMEGEKRTARWLLTDPQDGDGS